ncbi:hypothetical protein [Pseudaminobacter soli (ex Li et al. 2025)]|uniref:hypothetical protein n=1 Tax=Pseudaminobacter soli (ex Li et al. 2025) TaxID=1295366 RepID=UPI001FE22A34|nr:hypothetical protein [Mesorhizobium soli]
MTVATDPKSGDHRLKSPGFRKVARRFAFRGHLSGRFIASWGLFAPFGLPFFRQQDLRCLDDGYSL